MERKSTEVNGIRMHWEEEGDGLPVVLVHGFLTGPRLWRYVTPRIEGARVMAWEMVGYGGSIPEGRGRDISVGRQADYMTAWLETLDIDRAILGGHDLGGGVVQIAAARSPELCAGLLFTNAIGYDSWPIPMIKALRATGALVEHLPPSAIRTMIVKPMIHLGHDNQAMAAESLDVHWQNYGEHDAAHAFIRQVRSLNVHDTLAVRDRLPHLEMPARVVWGEADFFQKVRYGEFFARDFNTQLQRIADGRHFTPEDHPETIAGAINDLLREVQ